MQENSWGKYRENLLRVEVDSCDENYLYVNVQKTGTPIKVCYGSSNRYLSREGNGDWSYLQKIVGRGDVLNLVRLRWEDDICHPELIIYQPDYLINITSIAACFDECLKESPFVGLINKVKADEPSVAMHLGNLAGKLLDEEVHQSETSYSESFNAFFHDAAFNLSCCEGMSEQGKMEQLHDDGEKQKRNIQQLITKDLADAIGNYDRSKVVLEPSFISEVLGIQGRLDFLYEDEKETVIVEQKSGKGAFVPFSSSLYDKNIPSPVTKHVVQLLLYRALFQYEFQKYADQLKHTFLLYSKYSKGLVPVNNNPNLLLRAFRMRNLLTWSEIQYTKGGFSYLDKIKPSTLKSPTVGDGFWMRYKDSDFQRILAPIHQASELERAYYYRFQRFIATEQLFSKMGNRVQDDAGFSSIWIDSLESKKAAGNIYNELSIVSFADSNGSVKAITLAFNNQSTDLSNFRKGDIVFLYPYRTNTVPNACAQMVQRGSIVEITPQTVTLQLRNRQTDRKVFDVDTDMRWAIEHDLMDASSNALYRGMHSFLSANKTRRDLILLQREPITNRSLQLDGEYGTMNELVLHAKQSKELFLVIGPPGTGKTSFGMLNILQEELHNPNSQILLLSFTNRAVDEMCSKLVEVGIDFMRIGSDLSSHRAYRDYLADRRLRGCKTPAEIREELKKVRVMCGTTVALNANSVLFNVKHFDLAIIDEASQILEPHIIALLSAQSGGLPTIGKFVLIGDHKQLPAVVQQSELESEVDEGILRDIGLTNCRNSLFERMLRHFRIENGCYDERFVYMLTKQGRMHQEIAEFPNHAFYEGKLQIVGSPILPHQDAELPDYDFEYNVPECVNNEAFSRTKELGIQVSKLFRHRVAFADVPTPTDSPSDKVNSAEADLMAETIMQIVRIERESFDVDKTVGVIVPYRNQIATVRNAIDIAAQKEGLGIDMCEKLHRISIDTVERYQGSQREYILYGFTILHTYQLNFLSSNSFVENGMTIDRKLNVAMTRARRHLFMYGSSSLLSDNVVFRKLIEYVKQKNAYFSVISTQ